MTTCPAVIQLWMTDNQPVTCLRDAPHLGQHQNWTDTERFTWDDTGAAEGSRFPKDDPARAAKWEIVYVCSHCGQQENWAWSTSRVDESLCFHCNHWASIILNIPDKDRVVIDHRHYQIGPVLPAGANAGFDGRLFRIVWHDGRQAETRNLWTQGEIPPEWRDQLPDNAAWAQP